MIRSFAAPYAKAFAEVYPEPERAKAIHAELVRFHRTVQEHEELYAVMENPAIDAEAKKKIAETIAKQLGVSADGLRILEVLAGNQRLHQMEAILEAWIAAIHRQTGTVVAEIRSAHALSDAERAELQTALEKKTGRRVAMEVSTDPSLLAGFIAQIGSELWDASVAGQIRRLEKVN